MSDIKLGDPITCAWCKGVGPATTIINDIAFDTELCWEFWVAQQNPLTSRMKK